MSIVIDLVIIGIILFCLYGGYRKGLIGVAFSIVSFLAAIVIAFILFNPISAYVIENTEYDNNIKQAIVENFNASSEETDNEKNKDFISEYITVQIDEVKGNTAEVVSTQISELCIKGIVFIAIFIVAKIALFFIKSIADFITKLPILKQFNKAGGIVFGLLEGLVIVYVILAILMFTSPMFSHTTFYNELNNSYIGSLMYKNNIIIQILF